eukprot:3736575-Amphidinium_carterae.1
MLAGGRRAVQLSLPPVWQEQGVYIVDKIIGQVATVRHRYLQASADIELIKLPVSPVTIECNWSDRMARLCVDGDLQVLSRYFTMPFSIPDGL